MIVTVIDDDGDSGSDTLDIIVNNGPRRSLPGGTRRPTKERRSAWIRPPSTTRAPPTRIPPRSTGATVRLSRPASSERSRPASGLDQRCRRHRLRLARLRRQRQLHGDRHGSRRRRRAGSGTLTVTVNNVAPTVEAGPTRSSTRATPSCSTRRPSTTRAPPTRTPPRSTGTMAVASMPAWSARPVRASWLDERCRRHRLGLPRLRRQRRLRGRGLRHR